MNTRAKKQLSVLIGVACVLILLIIVGIIFAPGAANTKKTVPGKTPVAVKKYTFTGRIYDEQGNPAGNTRFGITCGPTDFTTDSNGFFTLKNVSVGVYELYAYDENGKKVGNTQINLSTDGCVTVGYTFYEKGATVTLKFNGSMFVPYTASGDEQQADAAAKPVSGVKKPAASDGGSQQNGEAEDETYTNFSWMKNIDREYGAYNIDLYNNFDLFYQVLDDPSLDYFNTYIINGRNIELMKKTAEVLKAHNKKMWVSTYDLLYLGEDNVDINLRGDWRDILKQYCSEIKYIAGDNFQGVYFDEPSHRMNSKDFTRVTKYIRETFKCRVFAMHASNAFMTPYSKGMDIVGYKPTIKDPMIISAENHKYVTDVGWWRYGGLRFYGDFRTAYTQFARAITMLDPNTRKWCAPVLGAFDWRHEECDALDVQYRMFQLNSQLEGFGGIMQYSMWHGSAFDAAKVIKESEQKKRLTDNDFLRDENGEYVLDENGNRIIHLEKNNSPANLPDRYIEGYGSYFIIDRLPDGSVRWPKMRQYVDIIGNGFMSNTPLNQILGQLETVYKPDLSEYDSKYEDDAN